MGNNKVDLHLGRTDWLLIGISALGIAFTSLHLFSTKHFNNLLAQANLNNSIKLGVINRPEADVRRKFRSSLTWYDVFEDAEVYEGDTIFTGDDSAAFIDLENELTLNLEPNSLVVLNRRGDEFVLNLKVGSIIAKTKKSKKTDKAKRTKKITIVQNNKVAKLDISEKSTVAISKGSQGDLNLVAKEGATQVDVQGKIETLNKDEQIKVDKNIKIEKIVPRSIELSPPALAMPEDSQEIEATTDSNFTLMWNKVENAELYDVHVAQNEDFQPLLYDNAVSALEKTYNLSDGQYFWRVRAKTADGSSSSEFSQPRQFKIIAAASAPGALSNIDMTITYGKIKGKGAMAAVKAIKNPPTLKWAAERPDQLHKVQVASTEDFKKILFQRTTKSSEATWKGIIPGKYYYRVSPVKNKKDKDFKWSELGNIKIKSPAPVLKSEKKLKLQFKSEKQLEKKLRKIDVKWKKQPLVKYYLIKIDGKPLDKPIKGTKASLPLDTTKPHSLEIAASNRRGEALSEFSNPQTIKIQKNLSLKVPELEFPIEGMSIVSFGDDSGENLFTWTEVKGADSYEIQISNSKNFKEIVYKSKSQTSSRAINKKLAPGTYFWRVRAVKKSWFSDWSPPSNFEL